ncbi:MAG: DUF302 domain-containing protein [Deltaproteobacteria bacterium]|nr:DUF302 domain-containing protein [Deltaproteobacteria bacterium]
MKKVVEHGYDEVMARIPELLKEEGFGILTEIDVQATLKKKLDLDFRRYRILGACNPPFAHQALSEEIDIGVMMPCNVVVYEGDDGKTHVTAIDPGRTMGMLGKPRLAELGRQVSEKLARVLEKL